MQDKIIDHLFRHQFGKMVSILTKIFGFEHLELIEDAIQDTFVKAIHSWKTGKPENPEAWLTAAAKNRVIDIFRSLKAEKARGTIFANKIQTISLDELFLEDEITDSQLRMIFTACHPELDPKSQIAFALKTISGFSSNEIAAALLSHEETIKKRLQRARKKIIADRIAFEIPKGPALASRINRVLEVIYVIFNEGFHSNKKELIIRKDLCGEALRLCKLILQKPALRTAEGYALLALICFHSSRLDSRINSLNELIPISEQDRSLWYFPLMTVGNNAMNKATELSDKYSSYHYEAAIVAEHLKAPNYEFTDWKAILYWLQQLYVVQPQPLIKLDIAIAHLQLNELKQALSILEDMSPRDLSKKAYLYHATMAEYYFLVKEALASIEELDKALFFLLNDSQRRFLEGKRGKYQGV